MMNFRSVIRFAMKYKIRYLTLKYWDENCHDLDKKVLTDVVDKKHDFDDPIEDITRKLGDFNLQNDFPTDRGHFRGDTVRVNRI